VVGVVVVEAEVAVQVGAAAGNVKLMMQEVARVSKTSPRLRV